jgi:hypothetical protein
MVGIDDDGGVIVTRAGEECGARGGIQSSDVVGALQRCEHRFVGEGLLVDGEVDGDETASVLLLAVPMAGAREVDVSENGVGEFAQGATRLLDDLHAVPVEIGRSDQREEPSCRTLKRR